MTHVALEIVRIVAVVALVCAGAAVLTPKGRVPLALRGVLKVLRNDRALACAERNAAPQGVPLRRRLLGAVLILLAFTLACAKL